MRPDPVGYPFTAVVGMDDLALALCLAAVSPRIGGVLVRGEKGTAKSTMVRALSSLLPRLEVVEGCRFSCDPADPDPACPDGPHPSPAATQTRPSRLVELPVGAAEDRLTGSLHLDRLLGSGEVVFDTGLLAQANRGLLYVDEVNLLPDHLVDTLLDAAGMGRARVEREGVSVDHAAQFVLVGTMNPEEGELRPQLLDRFGLTVDAVASRDPAVRVDVIRRRLAFEQSPTDFAATFADSEAALSQRISAARRRVDTVVLPDAAVLQVAHICAAYGVDGMRADLVTARAAIAHAAWCGRGVVETGDIEAAARLALPHRRRRNPFDAAGPSGEDLEQVLDACRPDDDPDPDPGSGSRPEDQSTAGDGSTQPQDADQTPTGGMRDPVAAGAPFTARKLSLRGIGDGAAGRRSKAFTAIGRPVSAVRLSDPRGRGLSVLGTVRAALPSQQARGRTTGESVRLHSADARRSLRQGHEGNLVVFVVDTSGSMGAARRMQEVKTAVVSLLLDAYRRRDKVAVVTFAGSTTTVVLPPTTSVERAQNCLAHVPTGGRTPLAEGLAEAAALVQREELRDPSRRALLVVLTDGRATYGGDAVARSRAVADAIASRRMAAVVVDCESGGTTLRLGLARGLAEALGADCLDLGELAVSSLHDVARARAVA